jgi:hypothetical protein
MKKVIHKLGLETKKCELNRKIASKIHRVITVAKKLIQRK